MGSAVGFAAGTAGTVVAWLLGAGATPLIGLVLLTVVAAVVDALTSLPGALAGATQCWALYDGFVAHRLGELSFAAPDLTSLAVVLGAGVVGVAGARLTQFLTVDHAGDRRRPAVVGP